VVQTVPLQCIPLCLNHRWVYATLCNWVLDLIFSHSSISISPVCPQYVPSISWLQVQFHRFPWVCKPPGSTTTAGEKRAPATNSLGHRPQAPLLASTCVHWALMILLVC
jgi:hypothetical protein